MVLLHPTMTVFSSPTHRTTTTELCVKVLRTGILEHLLLLHTPILAGVKEVTGIYAA